MSTQEATSTLLASPSSNEKAVHHPIYSNNIPTTAVGPATITLIVMLVLVTCCILHCSRVRQRINNRIISERCRKIQEQHEKHYSSPSSSYYDNNATGAIMNNHHSSPSFGSFSTSSSATVREENHQQQLHNNKDVDIERGNDVINSPYYLTTQHENYGQQQQHQLLSNDSPTNSVIIQQPPVAKTRPLSSLSS